MPSLTSISPFRLPRACPSHKAAAPHRFLPPEVVFLPSLLSCLLCSGHTPLWCSKSLLWVRSEMSPKDSYIESSVSSAAMVRGGALGCDWIMKALTSLMDRFIYWSGNNLMSYWEMIEIVGAGRLGPWGRATGDCSSALSFLKNFCTQINCSTIIII